MAPYIVNKSRIYDPKTLEFRETALESIITTGFRASDPHFECAKETYSDGVIRYYDDEDNLIFVGEQEVKLDSTGTLRGQLFQGLAYIRQSIDRFGEDKVRFICLSCPELVEIFYFNKEFFNSYPWGALLIFQDELHTSPSKMWEIALQRDSNRTYQILDDVLLVLKGIKHSKFYFKDGKLDFRLVTQNIVKNCLRSN